jgi:hypothetical protein
VILTIVYIDSRRFVAVFAIAAESQSPPFYFSDECVFLLEYKRYRSSVVKKELHTLEGRQKE